jgi:hypothetical protein
MTRKSYEGQELRNVLIAAAIVGALVPPAVADELCSGSSGSILRLTNWSSELIGDGAYSLKIEFESIAERPVRMVEGSAYFSDALDRSLGSFKINPDLALAPGEKEEQQWPRIIVATGEPRLAIVSPADVIAKICVDAVVNEDGSVERFDG